MPASLISEESHRAPSALSVHHPTAFSTAASSRATSPLPIPNTYSDVHRTISPSHSRATSPVPKSKRRPSISRHHTTNTSFSPPQMDGLMSRVLAEEKNQYISHMRTQVNELATELKVRTEALEQAYERVESADRRTVETHKKYLAEASARSQAEAECRRAQDENKKTQMLVEMLRAELSRVKKDVETLEAAKAEAEGAAGRARAVAKELKQSMKAERARESGVSEGWVPEDRAREKEMRDAIAAAAKDAYERGKAEGEASATMKALAAFDKLMENDDLAEWDDSAKKSTRDEIKGVSRKPSAERAKSPQPIPPKRSWSIRRGSSSNAN
ncbi:hypothetical protein RHS04_02931 [Rhizoctonia solani]|uniref:Uncharacterized protein n=1 Tax=Rhizoctonia solani TaxID=456999 RepID=A0A8H7HC52_9AGAM|nr:hypothetical protein RHS04_02931 [Rhizoctonia solani]